MVLTQLPGVFPKMGEMMGSSVFLSDQSHMEQIREALWRRPGAGASVMVGSGFSRLGLKVRTGAADCPLWWDLAEELTSRLYPEISSVNEPARNVRTSGADDFLRIAQEYETSFGRTNLHRFLQEQTRDDDFAPGEAHGRLLRLPWRDVFTTNWDTLLERARPRVVERGYHVVENTEQIPLARQPRIVKLHGSLPSQFPLVFTEEDYRTYPAQFALFVNTVQQAMMESVFCLIGFSGNDPNFLYWSGWVRDHLGKAAPKIYLAGWFGFSPHRRRMLEYQGVIPIDLAHHPLAQQWPENLRHRYATEWVLNTLERGQPYDDTEWPSPRPQWEARIPEHLQPVAEPFSGLPESELGTNTPGSPTDELDLFRETLRVWKKNRLLYPGWLVFPTGEQRERLSWRTDEWERQFLRMLPDISLPERLEFIHELLWRREILLQPVSKGLEGAAESVLETVDCQARTVEEIPAGIDWEQAREAWRNVALSLLTSARFQYDSNLFSRRVESLQPYLGDSVDVQHRVTHEQCLWAVNSLDFQTLESRLAGWSVEDCDPAWIIRKAALLWELHEDDQAQHLAMLALNAIRTNKANDRDVAGASREGWALCSTVTVERWRMYQKRWDELSRLKCDAWSEKDLIHRRLDRDSSNRESPNFDMGRRRQTRITFSGENSWLDAYRAIRLSELAGLPPATRHAGIPGVDVARRMLGSAAVKISAHAPETAVRLVLRTSSSESDSTLQSVITRNRLAMLPVESVTELAGECTRLIEYGLRKGWLEQTRVSMEVLSRLVLRLEADQVPQIFDRAMAYYADWQNEVLAHHWLDDPIWDLMRRSWAAMPAEHRSERILGVLGAPVVDLDGFHLQIQALRRDPGELLDNCSSALLPERSSQNEQSWQWVSGLLTRGLIAGGEARRRAASRLRAFRSVNRLTHIELSQIGKALWSDEFTEPDELPSGTDLYDWAFLAYPEPEPGIAEDRFRRKWFSITPESSPDTGSTEGNTVAFTWEHHPVNPESLEDTIWNVGMALSIHSEHSHTFALSATECQRVIDLLTAWSVEGAYPRLDPIHSELSRRPTELAIDGVARIVEHVDIPEEVGERIYAKLKGLNEAGIPALKPIGGLARIIPARLDDMVLWLRSSMVSDDREEAYSALSCLVPWVRVATGDASGEWQPPRDVFREVGLIITARRQTALRLALEVATLVFNEGTQEIKDIVADQAAQGLAYLSEELRYDREHSEESEVPLLRMRCAELALAMSKRGLANHPSVSGWLEEAQRDPYPEVRGVVEGTTNV